MNSLRAAFPPSHPIRLILGLAAVVTFHAGRGTAAAPAPATTSATQPVGPRPDAKQLNALRVTALGSDAAHSAEAIDSLAAAGPAGQDTLRAVLLQLVDRDAAFVAKSAAAVGDLEKLRAAEKEIETAREKAWEHLRMLKAAPADDAVKAARRHYDRLLILHARAAAAYARQAECATARARRADRLERPRTIAPATTVAPDADSGRLARLAEQATGMEPDVVADFSAGALDPPKEPERRGLWSYVTCRRIETYNRTVEPVMNAQEIAHARRINAYRELLGLLPLEFDARLTQAGRRHSREMIDLWYFSHWSPVAANRSPFGRMRDAGYDAPANENLTIGRWTGEDAFWKLFDSPPHHLAMVSPRYTAVGVGKWDNAWTQDLGAGPRLMLATVERRAAAKIVGDVIDPQPPDANRNKPQRDLATMKTVDPWGREQPIKGLPRTTAPAP